MIKDVFFAKEYISLPRNLLIRFVSPPHYHSLSLPACANHIVSMASINTRSRVSFCDDRKPCIAREHVHAIGVV